ncbi:uracil-DNA glycosylase [Buchnera aphidicola (Muscaphis stroyani)]|uniref:Uracil-DNA glycosylase n=1 Tax=Buchnera aphidicola (Muscaphis stroyani) TaxID=1241869 RepID=A0A4D6YG03_9GAMM|nr:uracil-DNA glycosylase [Buchnera aphidicola]QCI24640.1 uracil-DNA glycosylase [Buchnera aphidicola (Muscaphis stroyani)]
MSLTWKDVLSQEKKKYFINMMNYIKHERLKKKIYPSSKEIFSSFILTKFKNIKVVILGQDPYFSKFQAHGLAFSVPKNSSIPPSLRNIFKELNNNFHKNHIFHHGCLESWSKQGVFLLNTILTVEEKKPKSHSKIGWDIFTNQVISMVNLHHKSLIFLLWGKCAQKKSILINSKYHYVLKSSHPSPLSANRGFFGCNHFFKTNEILIKNRKKPINWFF